MIRRLDHITNLAIVGMSVVVPGGGGIDEFGRLVYRGLPLTGHFGETLTLKAAAVQSVRQVCGEARLAIGRVPVVSLSLSLTQILQDNGTGSRVQEVSSVPSALAMASDWLESGGEDVVLLVEVQEDPQAVCALLVAEHKSAQDNARPIYSLVTGAAEADGPLSAVAVSGVLQEARRSSGVLPEAIGLIEAATLKGAAFHADEASGMLGAFGSEHPLTCALGISLAGLLGVAKTAWCLSRRVIPGVPEWGGPAQPDAWQRSPFYVPAESRAWFIPASQNKRHAGLNLLATDGRFTHILFCDAPSGAPQRVQAPREEALRLFPVTASSVGQLLEKLTAMQSKLAAGASLAGVAQEAYRQYLLEKPAAEYVACLLSQTPDELLREIGFAVKGVPTSFEKQSDWQTPLGSFFTPRPLGKNGKVSFVYPGAFNSYPGVGRDLFYLFPNLYDHLSGITDDIGDLLNERLLYPRSMAALTSVDLTAIETQLTADPITMLISGSCLAFLYTDVLRNVFEIHPASAFGYSLGEVSMMFASRVWTEADGTSKALRESPLFRKRLTGPQNAVREFWNLPTRSESDPHEALWVNYLLMTSPEKVKEALADETRVYLTHINTPRQVAIGGDPAGCRRVIDRLKCKSLQAPFNYAIHCEPIHSEYDMLTELHSVPVMNQPGMTLYSAATYQPMPIDRQTIAQQIAHELCNCLDFPRLIQLAYQDGARIFIELGAGSNCARWVNDTLQGQPHAAYSINRKGVDDHTSILRLMARMVSQHVPVNLSVLYQS
ncbi:MAG TPA: PfaB family protein [Anaerolineales bacterium]